MKGGTLSRMAVTPIRGDALLLPPSIPGSCSPFPESRDNSVFEPVPPTRLVVVVVLCR